MIFVRSGCVRHRPAVYGWLCRIRAEVFPGLSGPCASPLAWCWCGRGGEGRTRGWIASSRGQAGVLVVGGGPLLVAAWAGSACARIEGIELWVLDLVAAQCDPYRRQRLAGGEQEGVRVLVG